MFHRAASTTQRGLSVTNVAPDTSVTRAEVDLMTASPAPARTTRPPDGKVIDTTI